MPSDKKSDIISNTVLADPAFRYYPLWDIRENEIFCYICEPFWDIGDGLTHPEEAFTFAFSDPRRVLTLDMETLHHAVSRVDEVAGGYGVFNVMIPVHFMTLADPATASIYVDACNESVWPIIDFLSFEIIHPPTPIDPKTLTGVVRKISSFGKNVLLRVEQGFDEFESVTQVELDGLGMDIRGDERSETDIIEELRVVSNLAGAAGFLKYVHGIETSSLSLLAVAAGFDFIGSDAIAEPLEEWAPDGDTVAPVDLLKALLTKRDT